MGFSVTTVLVCLVAAAYAAPTAPVAPSCQDDVLWKSGSTYRYLYTTTVNLDAVGTTDRKTGVQITCNVDLSVLAQCRYVLKLSDCGLGEIAAPGTNAQYKKHPRSNDFKELLTKYPVSFVMSDGEVEGVLANEQEPISVLNIKRGIISALLTKKSSTPEGDYELRTDVHGTCPSHYTATDGKIEFTADLNKCHTPSKLDWHLSPYSLFWNASLMQYALADHKVHCTHDLDAGTVSKVACEETYESLLERSTDTTATVRIHVHQTLEAKGTKGDKANFDRKSKRVTGILYEWESMPQPTEQPADFLNKANKLMADLVQSTSKEIQQNTIRTFDQLLKLLRHSPDVTPFVQSVINCQFQPSCNEDQKEMSMSYLKDIVVTCNTVGCMKGLRVLASNPDHMSNNYFNCMLYSLTKVKVSEEEYIGEVLKICKARTTRTCLLSLTAMIHSFSTRVGHDQHHHQPKAVKDTVEYLSKMIGNDCNPDAVLKDMDHAQSVERIILVLKSFGNLGSCAQHSSATIVNQLSGCVNNHDVPHNITINAIRAFRRMEPNPQIYSTLLNVIKNHENSMEERVIAYLVLSRVDQESDLYDELVRILPSETSSQLGNFVTMHMNNVLVHSDPSLELLQKKVSVALNEHPDVFHLSGPHPKTSSRHREYSRFYSHPALYDAINRFGMDVESSAIFETASFLPQHVIFNLTTQLFSQTFNTFSFGAAAHGLEPVIEAFIGPVGLLRQGPLKDVMKRLEESGHSILEYLHDPVSVADKSWTNHFDERIENKLAELHDVANMEYGRIEHFAALALLRNGDELAFTSLDLIKNRIVEFMEKDFYELNWEDFLHYHTHRFVRFLESRGQIPTMAGLPLYAVADATTAFSIRGKVKADVFNLMQIEPFLNAEWRLATSAVLDLNLELKVKVPGFTKVGFQALQNVHRSRVRAGELAYKTGDLNLKLNVPDEPQVAISLQRTNKLIFNDKYEDIPDYQIERINQDSCHSGKLSGLKFCRKKSFADVFDDPSKPGILLAGNLEYKLWVEKEDKGLKAYEVHVKVDKSKLPEKVTTIDFKAPGTKLKREVNIVVKRNLDTKEFSAHLKVPEKPHVRFDAERKLRKEGGKDVGYTSHIEAMFVEGRPITLHGTSRKVEGSKELNLKLTLKERSYTYERKYTYSDNAKNLDASLTYESTTPQAYMHNIFPDMFWENDNKAYAKLHVAVDKHDNDVEFERKISGHIQVPKAILELNTHRLSRTANDRRILHVRLDSRNLPSRELRSFINFAYDMHSQEEGGKTKRNHVAHFQIPKVRWTVSVDRNIDSVDNKNVAIIKREKATDNTMEVTDSTSVKALQVRLQIDHHNDSAARGDVFPTPRERHLTIKLTYPRDGKDYTVSYNGQIINDEGQRNAIRSFHTDSNIESERFQLKIHANTDYLRSETRLKADHKSEITYVPTGKTAKYNLNFDLNRETHKFDLSQTFDSSFYTFDEKAHFVKQGDSIDGKLTIKANSPVWDFLNIELEQTLHLSQDDSRETMSLKHKLVDIDVKAEFKLPIGRYYKKEFHIKSKSEYIPNMNLYLFHHDYIYYSAHLEYPDDQRNAYAVMEAEPGLRGGDLEVVYNTAGHDNVSLAEAEIRILTPHAILVNGHIERQALKRACQLHRDRLQKLWNRWVEIKNDPDHPMNQFLKPIVKTTLADFQKELIERIQQRRAAIRAEIQEGLKSLLPIIQPVIDVLRGLAAALERLALKLTQHEDGQQRSVVGYFIEYLKVRDALRYVAKRLAQRIAMRMNTLTSGTRGGGIVIKHPLEYKNFADIPRPTPALARRMQGIRERIRMLKERFYGLRRTGAAYGTMNHVYTYDGKTYDMPNIPNDKCTYLLAHDFVFRRYSMLGQKNMLHILFPEVSISISRTGDIKFNGSQPAQIPYTSHNNRVMVEAEGGNLKIRSVYGLDLDVMPAKEVVLFHLNFWNHNRTLGLLGNNDNEIKNEYRLMNGQVADNIFDFVSAYDLSGQPACADRGQMTASAPCAGEVDPTCSAVYDKKNYRSPLYACFDIIDPAPFFKSCKKESQCGGKTCSVHNAYQLLCQEHGVSVTLPAGC